jgi:predicted methyltransferase
MRLILSSSLLLLCTFAFSQDNGTEKLIEEAMAAEIRTDDEVARDDNRMPLETLTFFGLKEDMRVLEMLPGGGWYTKILAPVLRENGELYVSIGTNNVRDKLLKEPGFDRVKVLEIDTDMPADGPFGTRNMATFDFGVTDLDMALTFRNMHNFTEAARMNINNAVFDALRSGGHYGIIDHSLRHMEPMTDENQRRADVVQIMKEVLASGFEFVDYSDLHYRPDDELRYEVGRRTVTGNTDRFTLLFRKP